MNKYTQQKPPLALITLETNSFPFLIRKSFSYISFCFKTLMYPLKAKVYEINNLIILQQ